MRPDSDDFHTMWYYSKNGVQLGPVTQQELSAKVVSGEVAPSDLIWKEGLPDWKPLAQVPEFQAHGGDLSLPTQIHQPVPLQSAQSIPNYLWQSIVVTVLCCMPFGVVSIVYAAKVDSLLAQGDFAGATAASKSAKTWAIAGVASWAVVVGIYIIFVIIAAGTGALN